MKEKMNEKRNENGQMTKWMRKEWIRKTSKENKESVKERKDNENKNK